MPEPIRAASVAEIRLACLHLAYNQANEEDSLVRCDKLYKWVMQDSGQSPQETPVEARSTKSKSQT